jgi:hypothetical protein
MYSLTVYSELGRSFIQLLASPSSGLYKPAVSTVLSSSDISYAPYLVAIKQTPTPTPTPSGITTYPHFLFLFIV